MTHKKVEVVWEDAWSNAGNNWIAEGMAREPGIILHTTGFLLNNNKCGVDIAMEWAPGDQHYRKVQHIPRSYVRSVRRVK